MEISQNIDWLKASKDQRAKLYVILRAISDLTGQSMEILMEEALGYKLLVGADYLRNFRRGAIAKSKAKLIAAWIEEHHPDTAHTIAPDLFLESKTADWNELIPQVAIKDRLRIIRTQKDAGLIQRSDHECLIQETIKLGEGFHFELESNQDGFAIAYQGYQGQWYPLPLGARPSDVVVPVMTGEQILPRHANNKPIQLWEKEDLGTHQFVIFIARSVEGLPVRANAALDECEAHLNQVTFSLDG